MSARKPLHPDCTGGVWCPVVGHVSSSPLRRDGCFTIKHIALTKGQLKTLRERRTVAA